jgi:hypothetical protein
MVDNISSEQKRPFKDKNWGKYMISIWYGSTLLFFIDLLFASLVAISVYSVTIVIQWLGQPWNIIPEGYIGKTMAVFCLIYVIALAIVAWWRHFRLMILYGKHIGNCETTNQVQESEQIANAE